MSRRRLLSEALSVWRAIQARLPSGAGPGDLDLDAFPAWAAGTLDIAVRLAVLRLAAGEFASATSVRVPVETAYLRERRERAEREMACWRQVADGFLQGLDQAGEPGSTPSAAELAAPLFDLLITCAQYADALSDLVGRRETDALARCLADPWLRARGDGALKQLWVHTRGRAQPVWQALHAWIGTRLAEPAPRAADLLQRDAPGWPAEPSRVVALNGLLDDFVKASSAEPGLRANQLPQAADLKTLTPDDRSTLVMLSLVQDRIDEPLSLHAVFQPYEAWARQKLRGELLRQPLALDAWRAGQWLVQMVRCEVPQGELPFESALRAVLKQSTAGGWAVDVRADIDVLLDRLRLVDQPYAPLRKLLGDAEAFIASIGQAPADTVQLEPDCWGVPAMQLLQQAGVERDRKLRLWLAHCAASGDAAAPPARWRRALAALVAEPGVDLRPLAAGLLAAVQRPALGPGQGAPAGEALLIGAAGAAVLKGIAWSALCWPDDAMAASLREAALAAFRKVPDHGARSVKLGNACIGVLGEWPGLAGAQGLGSLQTQLKQPSARATVDKALRRCAERLGLGRDDLDELAVDGHGLEGGQRRFTLGRWRAVVRVDAAGVEVCWFDGEQPLAAEPAAVRRMHAGERNALRQLLKDLARAHATARVRLERLLASGRRWPLASFRERYLDHPLLGSLTRAMVWTVQDGGAPQAALHDGRHWCDALGRPLALAHGSAVTVAPWHPALVPAAEVLAWRRRVQALGLRQPFKQVYREVYRLTDAERQTATYSNRFAGHVLRQHAMARVGETRGWVYRLQGGFDAGSPNPRLKVPHQPFEAEFWVQQADGAADALSEAGISLHVFSDQVRFHALPTSEGAADAVNGPRRPCALVDVPAAVFSEVMRDVDLLVAVSSVGADPDWRDGGPEGRFGTYWRSYAFGELGTSGDARRELLADLLPALDALRDVARLDGRHLVVQGRLRSYRIHLGSGHILMSPNDEYLCIVPDNRGADARSPAPALLAGDAMLAVILSKALMLAHDDQIRDPTILRQIAA